MAEQKDDFFEEFKRDVRRVLASDPLETMEESIGLFLKLPLLKPEQLAARDFKPDISELGRRVSAYQNSDGKSAIELVVQGQALEYHQMRVLKRISPSYQKQVKASEIFKILSQLNEQQTNVLYKTGIPPETDILAYMSAVQELKEHQIEIWWKFGFPKEISPVEYFNLLKDLDLYKTNVFNNIPVNKINAKVTLYEVIRGLHDDMQIARNDDEEMWHLQFEERVNPVVKTIIVDAAYARAGIKTENRFVLIAVDAKENHVGSYVECDVKILTQKCKDILSEHPGSYILIDGNLDAKYLQKNNFDFSYLENLVVGGDYVCSKQSKCFPYKVKGMLDCRALSKGSITKDTVLPITKKIDFGHSIAGLDVLVGILPSDEIKTIIVEPAFIRENSLHLDAAKELVKMYPGLQITDTKGNVYGQKKEEKVKPLKAKPEEKPEAAKQMLEQKIPGKHMGVKDIIKYCRTKRKSDFAGISEDELKRLIRRVVSDQRKNDIEKKMMRLADGTPVVCIDASQIKLVCDDILAVRQEDIDREAAKSKEDEPKTVTPKSAEPVAQSNVPQPIKITKYIPRDLYKAIRASSPHKITDVLRDINDINLDPIDPKMQDQDRIHIIKDGVVTVSSKVKKDGGACLVQSVDGGISCDRKRIIWGVANGPDGELIIVGIDFCADHDPNKTSKRQIYDSARQLAFKKRIYSAKELRGYLKVEDLLGNDNNTNISCVTLLVMGIMQKKR